MINLFNNLCIKPLETKTNELKFVTIDYNDLKHIESIVKLKDKTVELNGEYHLSTVFNLIMSEYLDKIRELYQNYGDDVKEAYTLRDKCDRKIMIKILKASNDIMTNGRAGQANFIIAQSKYLSLLRNSLNLKYYNATDNLIIPNFIICEELENEIIIGRYPEQVDPGLHIILNEDIWLKNEPYEKDGKKYLDITYAVEPTGHNPWYQYIILKLE